MTNDQYRELVIKLDDLAKKCTEVISQDFAMDKTMIFFKIREISGYLRDMNHITDLRENPNKVFAEFTPKKTEELEDARTLS